ncbi:hypothetical protein AV530_015842 [Patagioenas fasciata monilis]|uniref:Secreted protein n=1 Tax=Patagioenas fasciata monilis TaxID=372326 RepID=A0A1V4KJ05_PATFA|nr:hypothetical protein AV530_015842 [Patagioenas fasciata monilis]
MCWFYVSLEMLLDSCHASLAQRGQLHSAATRGNKLPEEYSYSSFLVTQVSLLRLQWHGGRPGVKQRASP